MISKEDIYYLHDEQFPDSSLRHAYDADGEHLYTITGDDTKELIATIYATAYRRGYNRGVWEKTHEIRREIKKLLGIE